MIKAIMIGFLPGDPKLNVPSEQFNVPKDVIPILCKGYHYGRNIHPGYPSGILAKPLIKMRFLTIQLSVNDIARAIA